MTIPLPAPPRKIGLMGPFGYGNLGDAATQDAMIQQIRSRYPQAEIVGFTLKPSDTEKRHGIKSFPISWTSWKPGDSERPPPSERLANHFKQSQSRALREVGRWTARVPRELGLVASAYRSLEGVDLLIISGGGQLEDYWGEGPWTYPYSLLKWTRLARFRGARIFFMSVGAGPIRATLSKRFIGEALSLADYRSYRDEFSKQLIQSIGFTNDDPVYPDLAFSLDLSQLQRRTPRSGPKRVVGIGLVPYMRPGNWPEHDETRSTAYTDKMASFAEWLHGQGHDIVFLPGETVYDQFAISDVVERLKGRGLSVDGQRIVRPTVESVSDLMLELSRVDVMVGSRFHGLLLAQLLGRPLLALSYQEKIESLMRDTGTPEACFRISDFELEGLKQQFSKIEQDFDALSARNLARAEHCMTLLREQYQRVFGR